MSLVDVFSSDPTRWGANRDGRSKSFAGEGSDLDVTVEIRRHLADVVEKLAVKTMLDAPCGDLFWMAHFLRDHPQLEYLGLDAMEASVSAAKARIEQMGLTHAEVHVADLATERLPQVDLIFERDCLQHLSNWDGLQVIKNFVESGSKYLIATVNLTDPHGHNQEIQSGGYRPINLLIYPFLLPPPTVIYPEQLGARNLDRQKYFGIWDLAQVRATYEGRQAPWARSKRELKAGRKNKPRFFGRWKTRISKFYAKVLKAS